MELRYILLGIGAIIIVVILLDGIRRNRRALKKQIQPVKAKATCNEIEMDSNNPISRQGLSDEIIMEQEEEPVEDFDAEPESQASMDKTAKATDKQLDYIVIQVMAPMNHEFKGKDILNCMMKNGCRYGDMKIFHRHMRLDGHGPIYFSVASAVSPGTFNLKTITSYTTRGLSFFMSIGQQTNPENSFRLMLDTAKHVAEQLKGIVCDDEFKPLTGRKMDEYERRMRGA